MKRKSFFVDELALRRARKALGVSTDAEAIRLSVETVSDMDAFWRFMMRSRKSLPRDSVDVP